MLARCLPFAAAAFTMLCVPAVASAEIEILNRGISPNPAVENTQATITVDVRVDRSPYTVEMGCCGAGSLDSPLQRLVLDAANPQTAGLTGTHQLSFNVGALTAAPGDRQVTVRVTDATGATKTTAFAFDTPATVPPAPPSEVSGATRQQACESAVSFGLVLARSSGSCWQQFRAGSSAIRKGGLDIAAGATFYETRSAFTLNGIPFPRPPGDTSYVLVEPTDDARGGQLGLDTSITIDLGPITLFRAPLRWTLPAVGSDGKLAAFTLPPGRLGGLPVGGSVEIVFRKNGDRFSTAFPVLVTLPQPIAPFPGADGGEVTGETQVSTEDGRGVSFDGGKISIENAALEDLPLKSLCISFMSAGVSTSFSACEPPELDGAPAVSCEPPSQDVARFDGSALVELPTQKKPLLGAYLGIAGGRFAYGGAFIDNASIPIVQGITLERVGLGLCLQPRVFIKVDGGLGFAGGIIRGDGSVTYAQQERGFFVEVAAALRAAGIPIGNGRMRVQSNGTVDFDLATQTRLAAGFLILRGNVDGFLQPQPFLFNVDGRISVCVDLIRTRCLARASATVSNRGAGGCGKIRRLTFGAFFFWQKPSGGRRFGVGRGCGFQNRVRVSLPRQAGATPTFPVPEDQTQYVAHIQGAGAPPKVRITSPSGTVITSGPDTSTIPEDDSFALLENPEAPETSIILPPGATPGNWEVEPLPGSTVTGIAFQAQEKKPTLVKGTVRKRGSGDGERRVVDLAYYLRPGDTASVDVIGKDYQQPIAPRLRGRRCAKGVTLPGRTRSEIRCARVTFTPKFGYAGTRTVRATVVDDEGATIDEATVARYRVGAPRTPTKVPAVRLVRRGTTVFAVWGNARNGVFRYGTSARLSDGRKLGHNAPKSCLAWRIPNVAERTSVTLEIQAGRTDLKFGGKVRRTLKANATYAGPKALRKAKIPKACASL